MTTLHDGVKDVLRQVIQRYGQGLIHEPGRLGGLLRDLCGKNKREIACLLAGRPGTGASGGS